MLCRRGEKTALLPVLKVRHHVVGQSRGGMEIGFSGARFVEIDQAFGQVGIVFQIGVEVRATGSRGAEQASIRFGMVSQQVIGGSHGFPEISDILEDSCGFSHGREHHAVP